MAIVNAIQINAHCGALIADEESWRLRMRRTFFDNSVNLLLDPAVSNSTGFELVYSGIGNMSFHYEIINKSREKLYSLFKSGKASSFPSTVKEIADIVMGITKDVVERRVNNYLEFLYGFNRDDLNKGFYEKNSSRFDITQALVKKSALEIASLKNKGKTVKLIHDNSAVLLGLDKKNKFSMFCLKASAGTPSYIGGGFEALGTGKYASGITFADFLKSKTLKERLKGSSLLEGLFILIKSALNAEDHFNEVGGYFTIAIVDGKKKNHSERFTIFNHHNSKLAKDIVKVTNYGHLSKQNAYKLLDELLKGKPTQLIEKKLYSLSKNKKGLDLVLRGYKI